MRRGLALVARECRSSHRFPDPFRDHSFPNRATMIVSPKMLTRLRLCRRDLRSHGIDLDRQEHTQLRGLVKSHLDYFQLMLGQDVSAQPIARLFRSSAAAG